MSMQHQRDARTDEIVQKYEHVLEAIHQAKAPFAVYDDQDILIAWNPAYQNLHPDAFKGQAPDDARRLSHDDVVRRNAMNVYADDKLNQDVAERLRQPHLVRPRNTSEPAPRQIFSFTAPARIANDFADDGEYIKRAEQVIPDFDQLIASRHTGAVLVDKTLTVRMINQTCYDLWDLKKGDMREGQHIRKLMEAIFDTATLSTETENREEHIASQCSEIADGKVEARELVLNNGQTLIYSVRELAGGMRLITYLDPVSRAVPGRISHVPSALPPAEMPGDAKEEAAVYASADIAEKTFGSMARIWRDLPEKYAGHVNRLRSIVTNLIGDPGVISSDAPSSNAAPRAPALTNSMPLETISVSGTLLSNGIGSGLANGTGQIDVLVCEDNDANQILFTQVLRATGYTFQIANNGREGIELYKSCRPRLIIMDVVMPEMDGLVATAAIRELEANTGLHTPIIAVTAHVGDDDKKLCFDAGMDDYLFKPVSPRKLEEKISNWMTEQAGAISA